MVKNGIFTLVLKIAHNETEQKSHFFYFVKGEANGGGGRIILPRLQCRVLEVPFKFCSFWLLFLIPRSFLCETHPFFCEWTWCQWYLVADYTGKSNTSYGMKTENKKQQIKFFVELRALWQVLFSEPRSLK